MRVSASLQGEAELELGVPRWRLLQALLRLGGFEVVLSAHDFAAGLRFQLAAGVAGHGAALDGGAAVGWEALGIGLAGDLGEGRGQVVPLLLGVRSRLGRCGGGVYNLYRSLG